MVVIAVTGPRPGKLGGYKIGARQKLIRFAKTMLEKHKPSEVITGMALGWDTAVAEAALQLRIPFVAAVPFVGQEALWQGPDRDRYIELLNKAKRMEIICKGNYSAEKLQRRNEWMVDNCDQLLALWDRKSMGGTANCCIYAAKQKVPIIHAWGEWQTYAEKH